MRLVSFRIIGLLSTVKYGSSKFCNFQLNFPFNHFREKIGNLRPKATQGLSFCGFYTLNGVPILANNNAPKLTRKNVSADFEVW